MARQLRPSLDASQLTDRLAMPSSSDTPDVVTDNAEPSSALPTIMTSPSTGSSTLATVSDGLEIRISRVP